MYLETIYTTYRASFTMEGSATVSNNTASSGGGVYVSAHCTFTMQDNAAVSNNTASSGGGAWISAYGTFTMRGSAAVSGNTASYNSGGVYIGVGTLRMAGGVIYGNNDGSNSNLVKQSGTSINGMGAALYGDDIGNAQYGSFNGTNWVRAGDLVSTDNTIRVVGGVLQ